MSKLILQNIIDDISFEDLPVKWQDFDFARFSKDKTLFDFQQQGLQNALKALWLYFRDKKENKTALFELYSDNGLEENFSYDLTKKEGKKTAKYLLEYDKDYPVINNKISFAHFINRMSFWMATGSGKTLIIIKLIEFLGRLVIENELPSYDILFLSHRDDLLEQFKNHVEEFNSFHFDTRIKLTSLRDYASLKRDNALSFVKNEINVFYYRSDLISDIQKEKIANFRNYDNGGKWYIFLDEAHKGDKEDSKRQVLYSVLSRNGFLFNFSATFTDPKDFATCVFNFNLSKFVEEGYGKHIYVSSKEVSAFRQQDDFSPIKKQRIVLKTLLLSTYINKYFEKIRKANKSFYHRPLLLTLVNSVSVEDSDLEMFFRELEKVAKNEIRENLLEDAKQELIEEFNDGAMFEFEELECVINIDLISRLSYKDILMHIFNAKTPANIEVLKIPGNRNELIFRLMSAERPFALIKIGDISAWLKDKLSGYEINESFENESYFRRINRDDSDINILMGSRSFYEGWDSNRPNILLFVNIGVGKEAKKFVLQSVGRGIRIEPVRNQRKRLRNLFNAKKINESVFEKVKNLIMPIETLFVFGTNAQNLKEIIKTLKEEKQDRNLGEFFIVNPQIKKYPLLIPVYRESERIFAEEKTPQKYSISREDFNITSQFYNFLGTKIALAKYDCEVKVLKKIKESFAEKDRYYDFNEKISLYNPNLIINRIFNYLAVKSREFDKFKILENEIVHFKKIKFSDGDKYEEIVKKIKEMRRYPERQHELDKQYGKIPRKEFERQMTLFEQAGNFEMKNRKIRIKYLANHYYLPVIVSETEKIDYINHIINVDSEIKFIEQLEEYISKADNVFTQFDWWMFSKLDSIDEVYIPYYDPKRNKINHFKPDFIFWLIKGSNYRIVFVDPKGTEHTDAYRKIDGFIHIFEDKGKERIYKYNGYSVRVNLFLRPRDVAATLDKYRRYWINTVESLAQCLKL